MLDAGLACANPSVCAIGQQSSDGFGHQLEAKLTCIAAAHHLGINYVHVPFRGKAHGERAGEELEPLLDFGRLYHVHRGRQIPRKPSSRATWPFPRPCLFCMNRGNLTRTCETTHDVPSWLKLVETNNSFRARRCRSCDDVFVSDNCYDFFNCHRAWPQLWLDVVPKLHALYNAAPKPDPMWTERLPPRPPPIVRASSLSGATAAAVAIAAGGDGNAATAATPAAASPGVLAADMTLTTGTARDA